MRTVVRHVIGLMAASCGWLLAAPRSSTGQVAYDSPKGRVEVLGLRQWTLAMLQDSIRHYSPGQELHDAACMVTLRDSLHFADASVEVFTMATQNEPTRSFMSIKVVEPEQAARVQWDTRPRDEFTSLLPDYSSLALPITDSIGGVWRERILYWLQFPDTSARRRALAEAPPIFKSDGERLYEFLESEPSLRVATSVKRPRLSRIPSAHGD